MELPFIVGLSLLAAVGLFWTAFRSRRYWGKPGARPFTTLSATLGVTTLALGARAVDPRAQLVGVPLLYSVIPVLWAVFAFEFTGRYDVGSPRRRLLLAAPAVYQSAGYVVFTVTASSLSGTPMSMVDVNTWYLVVASASGLVQTFFMALYTGMFLTLFCLFGFLLVATAAVMGELARYDHLGPAVALALAVSVAGPWLVMMTADTVATSANLDPASIRLSVTLMFVVSGIGMVTALERYDLFAAAPAVGAIGPDRVLEDLADPIVVVDHDERVIRHNPAAGQLFGTTNQHVGSRIERLLGHDVAALQARETIDVDGVDGHHQYEATVSDIAGQKGRTRGYAVVLREVTGREVRQQRLEVLNRVLRHNLRNDLTAIRGRAEMLGAETTDETVVRDVITETADDLVALSDRAREVEEMLSVPVVDSQFCNLASVVSSVVGSVTAEHDVDVSVTVSEDVAVAVDERILRPVVRNLVVNAVLHHDRPDPTVEVSATVGEGTLPVTLCVADDGPGVPKHERAAVERGREKALEHGSGLGLWAVKWGVARIGGHLDIRDNEPRGTVVDIRLPGTDNSEDASAAEPTIADSRSPSEVPGATGRSATVREETVRDDPEAGD